MAAPVPTTKDAAEVKEIIVLGASFTGFAVTHQILRYIVPALPNKGAGYHVTLIDRDATWFNRVPTPRAITVEEAMPLDKIFTPVINGFKEYEGTNKFTFLQARATSIDIDARTLSVVKPDGTTAVLTYYAFVFTNGASSQSPILGSQIIAGQEKSREAIEAFRAKLPEAKHIVIAGGGPAGVESAGEIGEFLNGKPGWFTSEPSHIKTKITVVTSADRLLPVLRPALGKKAEGFLKKVGANVVYNTSVVSTTPERAGRLDVTGQSIADVTAPAKVTLSDGQVLDADLYIPAYGLTPNTDWLPKEILATTGKIATDKFLRVSAAGPRVYAAGDVTEYNGVSKGGVIGIMSAVPAVIYNIKRDLVHDAIEEEEAQKAALAKGEDRVFADGSGETQIVPIGKTNGVGAIYGWKLPSFFVWLIKGRDFMMSGENPHPIGNFIKAEPK